MVQPLRDLRDALGFRTDALGIGPGLGRGFPEAVCEIIRQAPCPGVVDADALTMLAQHPEVLDQTAKLPRLLTPHPIAASVRPRQAQRAHFGRAAVRFGPAMP